MDRSRSLLVALALTAIGCRPQAVDPPEVPPTAWPIDSRDIRQGFDEQGRAWLERNSGLHWTDNGWKRVLNWAPAESATAQKGYYLEYATAPAVLYAENCGDRALLDELADFHLAYLGRFETFASLESDAAERGVATMLESGASATDRTLRWIEPTGPDTARMRECLLCNAQVLYPLARLLRVVATVPPAQRLTRMAELNDAWPLLIDEHLIRGFRRLKREQGDAFEPLNDRSLWLLATAAEVLGANALDPDWAPLSEAQQAYLRARVSEGTRELQTARTEHTSSGANPTVSFFVGHADAQAEYAHAGDSGPNVPVDPAPGERVGWDVSHYHRVPLVLRALYDNRAATGQRYPSLEELERVGDHLALVVARRAPYPQLRNFSDGSDGWYRVATDRDFGYPPSAFCDSRTPKRPCLRGGVMGWAALSFASEELATLLGEYAALARATSPQAVEHRARTLVFNDQDFTFKPMSTLALFTFAAGGDYIIGCGP